MHEISLHLFGGVAFLVDFYEFMMCGSEGSLSPSLTGHYIDSIQIVECQCRAILLPLPYLFREKTEKCSGFAEIIWQEVICHITSFSISLPQKKKQKKCLGFAEVIWQEVIWHGIVPYYFPCHITSSCHITSPLPYYFPLPNLYNGNYSQNSYTRKSAIFFLEVCSKVSPNNFTNG